MADTFTANVTQYMRPSGAAKAVTTELPLDCQDAYNAMQIAGCRFEAEVLGTGEVSITISNDGCDLDIEVSENGPAVQAGMVAMLGRRLWERKDSDA